MTRALIYLSLLLAVTGCSATGVAYHELPTFDAADHSQLVVFRKKQFADSGSCYTILVDDEELGVLANGGFLRTTVEPGSHTISIPHVGQNVLSVGIETLAGKTYYLEYNATLRGIGAIPAGSIVSTSVRFTFVLAEVTPDYASAEVYELRDSSEQRSCMATVRSR